MKRLLPLLAIATASFPNTALEAAAPGFTSYGVITDYYSDANQTGLTIPGLTNPMACSNPNNYVILSTATNYSAVTAAALTAYASGSRLMLYVAGCDSSGSSIVSAVSLHRP